MTWPSKNDKPSKDNRLPDNSIEDIGASRAKSSRRTLIRRPCSLRVIGQVAWLCGKLIV